MVNFFSKVYLRGRADPESIWKALCTWDKDIQYFYSIKTKTTSPKRAIIPIQQLVQQEVLSRWPSQLYSPSHISSYSEPLPQAWLGKDVVEEQGCERFPCEGEPSSRWWEKRRERTWLWGFLPPVSSLARCYRKGGGEGNTTLLTPSQQRGEKCSAWDLRCRKCAVG